MENAAETAAAPPPRVRFVTFGCKVNQYDTQVLRESARRGGYAESDDRAELIVVNTCTVTEHGGAEARKAVRRLARENPGARIYVTGCYAGSDPETAERLPGVTGVFGNDRKGELLHLLSGAPADGPFVEQRVSGLRGRSRAFVKVQDGCYLRCTFCIIPRVRPAVASKSPETVVREIRTLVDAGYEEVVLTGVHVGAYGRRGPGRGDRDGVTRLMEKILDETGLRRLRLSSIEAFEVTPALVELVAGSPRIAPHLHIPLQSGSARILARMRRRYNPRRFLTTVDRIRSLAPNAALSTDVIAGFPGESEQDFQATLDVLRRARVMKTHAFPYSPRRGTPAAEMDGRVPAATVRRRIAALLETDRELFADFAGRLEGTKGVALVESRRIHGRLTGMTERYVRVYFDGPDSSMGRLVPVRLEGRRGDGLAAREIEA